MLVFNDLTWTRLVIKTLRKWNISVDCVELGLTNTMVLSEQEKQGSVFQTEVFHSSGFSWIKEAGNELFKIFLFHITI